jgi:ribosomal protein S11
MEDKKSAKAAEKSDKKSAKAGLKSIKIKIKAKAGTPEAAKNMLKKAIR